MLEKSKKQHFTNIMAASMATDSCSWTQGLKCAATVASSVAECETNIPCYVSQLGSDCMSCCSCIPEYGTEICAMCKNSQTNQSTKKNKTN